MLAALQYTALHGPDMMRNFWRRSRNAVTKGETEAPYAVAIPEKQDDPRRLATMLNLLRAHGIEVRRASTTFTAKEGSFPAGTYLVRMDQPYRSYALDLLIAQEFPAEDTTNRPYDDVGWALPFSMGVEVTPIEDAAVREVDSRIVDEDVSYQGEVEGEGPFYLVRDSGQEAFFAARMRLAKFEVEAAEEAFSQGGTEYPPGSWVIRDQPGLRAALESTAAELGLRVKAVGKAPEGPRHALDPPRLAVLQTWSDTESAGWVRMVLDEERVPYTLIMDGDVRQGGLGARFDVILFPDTGDSLKGIINGIDPKHGPLAYTRTPEYPSHGSPTAAADITGGLTWQGVQHIEDFVRQGGVLVTLGGASTLPLDGGIARDVRRARVKNVYTPGSELRARFRRPEHPIAYGYPEEISAFRTNSPVYSVRLVDEGRIVLQWGTRIPVDDDEDEGQEGKDEPKAKPIVVSGGIKGGKELTGKPAILDIPTGKGRVVAFDFDPIHRCLTLSDFRLVWNAVLNWNDMPPTPE